MYIDGIVKITVFKRRQNKEVLSRDILHRGSDLKTVGAATLNVCELKTVFDLGTARGKESLFHDYFYDNWRIFGFTALFCLLTFLCAPESTL